MTQRVAMHTRLQAGKEAEYERVHATIPADLEAALRDAGVRQYSIWRDGQDLFHLIEVDDLEEMNRRLQGRPAQIAWQERIDALLDNPVPAAERPALRLVWELE